MPMNRRGSVNWQAGMLLDASHLAAETDFLLDLDSKGTHLALGWFGVHAEPGAPSPLELRVSVAGSECTVELRRLRGVFPDGLWVDFVAESNDVVVVRQPLEPTADQSLPIHVLASEEESHLFGDPDPTEDPPRYPYREPMLRLALGPKPPWARGRSMTLGCVRVRDGVASLDSDRIPPSATMASWPTLRDLAARYSETLERWRRIGVDSFIVLLPIATAPAGGMGRQLEYAKRETAFQWAFEIARLQAGESLLARAGTPPQWFVSVQSTARSMNTLLDLNRELARGGPDREGFEVGMAAMRKTIDHTPDPENLDSMAACTAEFMEGLQHLLDGIFAQKPPDDTTLGYDGKTYRLVNYSRRGYRRERNLEFLEINGLSAPDVEDCVVLLQGEIGTLVRKTQLAVRLGPNERDTWPTSYPALLDTTFKDAAGLIHPLAFRAQADLNRLTLVCHGAENLSAFERGADEDVRVYVHQKHSS